LARLPQHKDPALLVGFGTGDDAGVYRLNDEVALVLTADFITPPVDDPYLFGQIAAANALSDVYAMGGRPLACLNLVAFPAQRLGPETLHGIVAGALSKITEAGAVLAGGHTIDDEEPKFGLSVTGIVHPQRVWRNSAAQPGDQLILTKPLGSGVLFNANRKRWVSAEAMAECLEVLTTLNRAAAETLADFQVHAATDVTGFGLAGHAYEMAAGSGLCLEIELERVPLLREAPEMYRRGMTTGANRPNAERVAGQMRIAERFQTWQRDILFDPQTSGGLLVALPAEQVQPALQALHAREVSWARLIGRVLPAREGLRLVIS
jgi:selenide,water dikinase